MLEGRYLVQDDSWKDYPTARSIDKWILSQSILKGSEEPEVYPHLKKIADSLGKGMDYLQGLDEETQKGILQLFYIVSYEVRQLQEEYNLTFDIRLYQKRLWLFDDLGQKLISGFFSLLYVDTSKKTGLVLKNTFDVEVPATAQTDKELSALALIASEAFQLQTVKVINCHWQPSSLDLYFGSHTARSLQKLKQQIQYRLFTFG